MINMNPKYHLLIAVAALSLNACSTDDTCTEPEIGGYKISFTVAEDTETRTTLEMLEAGNFLRWVSTDKVGIYTAGQSVNSNIETTADVKKSPVEFVGTLEQQASSGDMFYAYYPYNAEQQSTDPAAVKLSIPAKQSQTKAGAYNGESNPLVAVPMEFSQEWGNAGRINSVRFRQLGAIVEMQLYSSDEALCTESIRSVAFESETPLAGDFSFNLKSVTVKDALPISGYESTMVTTSLEAPAAIPAAKDEAARVYLTIAPGQYTGQIVVRTDVAKYTFRLKNSMDFKRAAIKGLPADLAKAERTAVSPDDPIHFEDSAVEKICLDNWDTNSDGQLSYKEAAAVTSIGSLFKGSSIRSFNELQYFTGLQTIGAYAFNFCESLTSIHIPEKVTSIGQQAFSFCRSLTNITIPDGVTSIEEYAFNACNSLTSIHIPDGVTEIVYGTFCWCNSLTSVTIPDGVTAIGNIAFTNCSSLTSINIPQTVSSIGESVFEECTSLSAFYGKYASEDHRCLIMDGALLAFAPAGLTEYRIPDGVTSIGRSAFYNCSSLTSINIPQTVSSIGKSVFSGCSSLSAFYGKYASADNRYLIKDGALLAFAPAGLTEYRIPEGVTAIGNSAFRGCSGLTSIHIPEGVTTIENSAFRGCSSLTSVNIPNGVITIENEAFNGCSSLTSIQLPDKVTSIGEGTFDGCSSLTSITIPKGVTSIGNYAFYYCSSLASITIPNGVTEIGKYAFYRCSNLTSVYCKPTTPPTLGSSAFSNTSTSMQIYVPAASVDAYKAAENWSTYASQIVADNN